MKGKDANGVLEAHHALLRELTEQIDASTAGSLEHRRLTDRLMLELDIHMQIEDRLYYPAVSAVSPLVAVAHAEHREVADRLATALGTKVTSEDFQIEWHAFTTTLHHHAAEEERDIFPHARYLGVDALGKLGAAMTSLLERQRCSRLTRFRVHIKGIMLRLL